MDSNKLSINLKDYPELAAELAGSSPGDTVTFKDLEVTIDETGEDVLIASITECDSVTVTPGPNREEEEVNEEDAAPVLSVMSPGYRKKK